MTTKLALVLPVLATLQTAGRQPDTRPEIFVLGTYHMASPGHDVHNMRTDDVLSPRRQLEIAQLIDVLKRFRPTKIAIESDPGGPRASQYADYLAGTYTLTRNEIDQIGFRLARELGHRTVYPVDADGDFPYERMVNWAKAHDLAARFDSLEARTAARVEARGTFLQTHTVLQTLDVMNSDSSVAADLAAYLAYVPYGDRWDFAGPDVLALFYQRNIHIYHNIIALIDSPSDRVLVIFGSGHLGWLRQDAANDPNVRLRKLADLAH